MKSDSKIRNQLNKKETYWRKLQRNL